MFTLVGASFYRCFYIVSEGFNQGYDDNFLCIL